MKSKPRHLRFPAVFPVPKRMLSGPVLLCIVLTLLSTEVVSATEEPFVRNPGNTAGTENLPLEATAERFFRALVEKDVETLAGLTFTDSMAAWIGDGSYREASRQFRTAFGTPGKHLGCDILFENGLTLILLRHATDRDACITRVAFDEGKIAGIYSSPWCRFDVPIFLETPTGTLHASLMLPENGENANGTKNPAAIPSVPAPVPVVLIIAGSGPTDRNGNNPPALNAAPYRFLAEALRKAGIASIRFDKRGVGWSATALDKEENLRIENYVDDVLRWLDLLAVDARFSHVILLGHSEGSLVGMLACRSNAKADALISLCGAGRPIDALLREQVSRISKMQARRLLPILAEWKSGKPVDDPPADLAALARPSVQPYMISWLRYDPAEEIGKLDVPVLIVQGTTDTQVAVVDADLLAKNAPNAKKAILSGMNHVLKYCPSTKMLQQTRTYVRADIPLHEELVPLLLDFIEVQVKNETRAHRT